VRGAKPKLVADKSDDLLKKEEKIREAVADRDLNRRYGPRVQASPILVRTTRLQRS
jgi:hypothetical protein